MEHAPMPTLLPEMARPAPKPAPTLLPVDDAAALVTQLWDLHPDDLALVAVELAEALKASPAAMTAARRLAARRGV